MSNYYVGLMSGTSVDGIDAVLVDIKADHTLTLVNSEYCAFSAALREEILALASSTHVELDQLGTLNIRMGKAFADAAIRVIEKIDRADILAIGCHGQTVRHTPHGVYPYTLQLGCGATLAEQTGITSIVDFRMADMAARGQGAPLAPAFHHFAFSHENKSRTIVNIGGIANVTHLPPKSQSDEKSVLGFDTGPGNGLSDAWIRHHQKLDYDKDGIWARQGTHSKTLLDTLLADNYFSDSPPKSTGKEYFNLAWLQGRLHDPNISAQIVQTTLAHLTAKSICDAIDQYLPAVDEIYLCGGGCNNQFLVELIEKYAEPTIVDSTIRLGLHPDWVEAVAFAWLAKQRLEGKPGNIPSVTGAIHECVLGAIYQ